MQQEWFVDEFISQVSQRTYSILQGCDIPDIDVVVQWKLPATLSHFIQRAGRAARGHGRTGLAVLLVERSAFTTPPPDPTSAQPKKKKKKKGDKQPKVEKPKGYDVQHGMLRGTRSGFNDVQPLGIQPRLYEEAPDENLLALVQSIKCRRLVWAKVFDSEHFLPSRKY